MRIRIEAAGQPAVEVEWVPGLHASPFEDKRQDKFVRDVIELACNMAITERDYLVALERAVRKHPGGRPKSWDSDPVH